MKLAVMNRQPGLSWRDVGAMRIDEFFHVLNISEKNLEQAEEKLKKGAR